MSAGIVVERDPVINRIFAEGPMFLFEAEAASGEIFGRRVSVGTLRNWAFRGFRIADDTFVKLEVAKIGKRYVTSRDAMLRFLAATSAGR